MTTNDKTPAPARPDEVPIKLAVHLNPEARAALAKVMAAERAKVAGSLLSPPSAQDIVRGLILQAARAIDFGEAFRRELAEHGNATQGAHEQTTMPMPSEGLRRVLDAQGIKSTNLTPDLSNVPARIPQGLIGEPRTCDAELETPAGIVSCINPLGHPEKHRHGDLRWDWCPMTNGAPSPYNGCKLPSGHDGPHWFEPVPGQMVAGATSHPPRHGASTDDTRGPMQIREEVMPAPSLLPRPAAVSSTVLLYDRCTDAIDNSNGVRCHCLLKPGHEGWHEDSAADWTWHEAGGHIVEARLSERGRVAFGARVGNVLVHEGTPTEQRIVVPRDEDGRPMRRDMGALALLAQANLRKDTELFSAYMRAQNGRERLMTWDEFVADCRAQNSILETVPQKDGAS